MKLTLTDAGIFYPSLTSDRFKSRGSPRCQVALTIKISNRDVSSTPLCRRTSARHRPRAGDLSQRFFRRFHAGLLRGGGRYERALFQSGSISCQLAGGESVFLCGGRSVLRRGVGESFGDRKAFIEVFVLRLFLFGVMFGVSIGDRRAD